MNIGELIHEFRIRANDIDHQAPFWKDESIILWLNEAQKEAAIRGRLLHDRIEIYLNAGEDEYSLVDMGCPQLYEIEEAFITHGHKGKYKIDVVSEEFIKDLDHRWQFRWQFPNDPHYLIQHDTKIRVFPRPTKSWRMVLSGFRLPHVITELMDSPEINPIHHPHLVDWALFRAFQVPDADGFDPDRAKEAEAHFTQYFGFPVDSDFRRATRRDEPHHTEAFWI
jgi:hypothetical protein